MKLTPVVFGSLALFCGLAAADTPPQAKRLPPPPPAVTIAIDTDPRKIGDALDRYSSQLLKPVLESLRQRIEIEKAQGNPQTLAALLDLEEQHAVRAHGAVLPGFLMNTPASFVLKDKEKAKNIRFVAFGDFGRGSPEQKKVATAMLNDHKKKAFDFGITLGDNFYGEGMYSPEDDRWKGWWEDMYAPMGIKFYATLGNHDWYHPDSPAAEILYTQKSKTWVMPSVYYTYTAGQVQFFAINTEVLVEKQLNWLKEGLEKSTAKWKIVYSHHPIYSGSRQDNKDLIARLLPIVRGKADAYIAGHDHVIAHLKPEQGTEFFVSGGGGASNYEIRKDNPLQLYGDSVYGFLTVDVGNDAMRFRFIGDDNRTLYDYTAEKTR